MSPIKMMIAALVLALSPSMSSSAESPRELSEALFLAAHLGHLPSVVDLIQRGANVNHVNASRETAMHGAAAHGHLHVIQYLRARRGNMNARTVQDWIPLHHAVRFGHAHVANYLLANGAPLYIRTRSGQSVFDLAEARNDARMLNLLNRYR